MENTILKKTNPVPLGLLGGGLVTIFFNLHNLNLISSSSLLIGIGLFFGSILQITAGLIGWKNNDTFAATVFIGYGFFWFCLVSLMIFPVFGFGGAPDTLSMAVYFVLWTIFSAIFYASTFKLGRSVQLVFALLTILFLLFSVHFITGSSLIMIFAGWLGIVTGLLALYIAFAELVNDVYEKKVLPL